MNPPSPVQSCQRQCLGMSTIVAMPTVVAMPRTGAPVAAKSTGDFVFPNNKLVRWCRGEENASTAAYQAYMAEKGYIIML